MEQSKKGGPGSFQLAKAGTFTKRDDSKNEALLEAYEKSIETLENTLINFDLKSYVKQMIEERTEPILKKATKNLSIMAEM